MSEKENEMREMAETLKKLPENVQERIGGMIEGVRLARDAETEKKKDGPAA